MKNIGRNNNYFGSDHVLTIKKVPYKVGGQNDMNRKKRDYNLANWLKTALHYRGTKKYRADRVLTLEKAP